MQGREGKVSTGEIEDALAQVPGLLSCRVVPGEGGGVQEVHVLASPDRSAKHIVRDVEALLQDRFRLQVDYKRISVAQLAGEESGRAGGRFRVEAVQVRTDAHSVHVRVDLAWQEQLYAGAASGASLRDNRLRIAAAAALQALAQAGGGRFQCAVEDVALLRVRDRDAVIVGLSLSTPEGEEFLTGTALIRRDEAEAAVRASLDALNRRLPRLLRPQEG